MGLDMEIRRIYKPNYDPDKIYERKDIIDGRIFSEEEIECPAFRQLAPYCQKLMIRTFHYDMEKIRADYRLSDSASISCIGSTGIVMFDRQKRNKSVSVSDDLIREKYTLEKVEECFVCLLDEVRYWRKAYDIQEWFYENLEEEIENTGYYRLSEEILEKFNEAWPDDAIEVEDLDEESALFYWEWY